MNERMKFAQTAQTVIKREISARAAAGIYTSAIFLPSELLYVMKALPNPVLQYTHRDGESFCGVPVLRFESDDMSLYFLASAHYSDGRAGTPEVHYRPYYHNPKEVTNYGING